MSLGTGGDGLWLGVVVIVGYGLGFCSRWGCWYRGGERIGGDEVLVGGSKG